MFAKILTMLAIIYLLKVFIFPFFQIVSKKQKTDARKYAKTQKAEAKKRAARARKQRLAELFAKPLLSKEKEEELKKLLSRLNKDITPEGVVLEQMTFVLAALSFTFIMLTGNRTIGLVSSLFIFIGWFYPVDELRKAYEKKNTNIAIDFPEFYSMVFYQYSKSVNIFLSDVIRDYLPNANEDLASELNVMLDNINYCDETYALRQLKRRVPKHFIIKFCDVMETRLRGYDNVSQLQYLKNEIDAFRVSELEKELARRVQRNDTIQFALVAILFMYIFIYYFFDILGALKVFQF